MPIISDTFNAQDALTLFIFYVIHMLWNYSLLFYILVQDLTLCCMFLRTRSDLFMDKKGL